MEETPPEEAAAAVAKKSRSKPAVAATPEKSTAVKRGNGSDRDPKDLKRAKNKESDPEKSEDSKKTALSKSLHFEVSMTQLKYKISRSRKKFENHVKGKRRRKQANGKKNTKFNDNQKGNGKKLEALKTDLCIYAGEERMEDEMERDSSVKKVLKFDRKASVGTMDDYVVRSGLDFVHGMKKEEMEVKWGKLYRELFLKRNELRGELVKLMLSVFKADKD
ncbi:hypothetical protein SADUNF_Sadunf17G0042900 [Salix dunnii]|uniref:Uncharacterized protein n=1 Tax=Salix dunnii TaxID=1413687 RepID=A0A835J5U7_9ROSI|nr:hypothetical protein SADUNF_Sadunf17G0042900 [Salix dunnii]